MFTLLAYALVMKTSKLSSLTRYRQSPDEVDGGSVFCIMLEALVAIVEFAQSLVEEGNKEPAFLFQL